MKFFSFLTFGLLAIFAVGCADTTETYEVEKPVIDSTPDSPAVLPADSDSDLNVDDADVDVNLDDQDAENVDLGTNASTSSTSALDADQATSGAIQNEDALQDAETVSP